MDDLQYIPDQKMCVFLSITMLGYQRTQQGIQSGCKAPNHRKTLGYDVIFQQEHHDI